jgi:hypothetical protein
MPASMANRAMVLMAVTAVVSAACSGTASSSTAPSATAKAAIASPASTPAAPTPTSAQSPEVTPTPVEPTSTPQPPCEGGTGTGAFEPDAIVCVIEGPLRIRSRPNTSDDSVMLEPLSQTGERLFVIDGPNVGSGYSWYLVERTPGYLQRADGWVAAAARDGTPWLAVASVTCPAEPSLSDLASMDPMERIHCYHAREFTFTDTVVAGPMCGDGSVLKSPTWMAGCLSTFFWGGTNSAAILAVPPNLAGELGDVEPDVSFEATVTAHMDDPAALTCIPYEGVEADYELLNPGTVLICRTMFVATSFERVAP